MSFGHRPSLIDVQCIWVVLPLITPYRVCLLLRIGGFFLNIYIYKLTNIRMREKKQQKLKCKMQMLVHGIHTPSHARVVVDWAQQNRVVANPLRIFLPANYQSQKCWENSGLQPSTSSSPSGSSLRASRYGNGGSLETGPPNSSHHRGQPSGNQIIMAMIRTPTTSTM